MDKNKNSTKIKVFGYVRKSTEDNQEGKTRRQQNSLEYQKKTIKEIAERNGLEIVRIFEDSKTGYKAFIREGLEEMLELFASQDEGGPIKGIVCTEHSRLARNFGDGGLILWYVQAGIIKQVYTYDKVFTDSPSDQMMLAISFAMDKHSSDETRFRSRRTWEYKASKGQPPNQHLTGYHYVGEKGKKVWEIDPKNGPIVKDMFNRFASGEYSISEIFDYVSSRGLTSIVTKKPYRNERQIRALLKKKEYTGVFMYDGDEYPGEYSPLVSSEIFYKVQEILSGTAHPKSAGKSDYAYTVLVKCSVCGGNMSGTIRKGLTYYRCLNRAEPCKSNKALRPSYLREDLIDDVIMETLRNMEISEKAFKKISSQVSDMFENERTSYRYDIVQLRGKLSTAEGEFQDYTKEIIKLKKITKSERDSEWEMNMKGLQQLREDTNQAVESYKRMIIKAEEMKDEIPSLMINFLENIKLVGTRFKNASPSNKRQIVDALCANLKWDGQKLSWDWKKPYNILTDSDEKGNWLRE
ncbi:MAG: Recombinase [candidate division WS6 bacterium 34_10]|uniref:Recombinase n=1 Tax=candidate division WS6 bacterium 34_10 TaxID=1641389 RepID=A0A101HIX1_9BACT|nr:MAG: Recombinase [candidate division WS6 bacterium 34_10]